MNRSLMLILLMVVSTIGRAQAAAEVAAPWSESCQEGMARARVEKRPVLLDFRADWCGPCKLMERETFGDPEVMALLEPFVLIRVDIDQEEEAAFAWKISSIPRVIMLNVHGQVIFDQLGFVPPEGFLPLVRDALEHIDEELPEAQMAPDMLPSEASLEAIEQSLQAADDDSLTSVVVKLVGLPNRKRRQSALVMLGRNPERVRPVLMRLLGDARLAVRVGALESLKSIGVAAPEYDPWANAESRRDSVATLLPQAASPLPVP